MSDVGDGPPPPLPVLPRPRLPSHNAPVVPILPPHPSQPPPSVPHSQQPRLSPRGVTGVVATTAARAPSALGASSGRVPSPPPQPLARAELHGVLATSPRGMGRVQSVEVTTSNVGAPVAPVRHVVEEVVVRPAAAQQAQVVESNAADLMARRQALLEAMRQKELARKAAREREAEELLQRHHQEREQERARADAESARRRAREEAEAAKVFADEVRRVKAAAAVAPVASSSAVRSAEAISMPQATGAASSSAAAVTLPAAAAIPEVSSSRTPPTLLGGAPPQAAILPAPVASSSATPALMGWMSSDMDSAATLNIHKMQHGDALLEALRDAEEQQRQQHDQREAQQQDDSVAVSHSKRPEPDAAGIDAVRASSVSTAERLALEFAARNRLTADMEAERAKREETKAAARRAMEMVVTAKLKRVVRVPTPNRDELFQRLPSLPPTVDAVQARAAPKLFLEVAPAADEMLRVADAPPVADGDETVAAVPAARVTVEPPRKALPAAPVADDESPTLALSPRADMDVYVSKALPPPPPDDDDEGGNLGESELVADLRRQVAALQQQLRSRCCFSCGAKLSCARCTLRKPVPRRQLPAPWTRAVAEGSLGLPRRFVWQLFHVIPPSTINALACSSKSWNATVLWWRANHLRMDWAVRFYDELKGFRRTCNAIAQYEDAVRQASVCTQWEVEEIFGPARVIGDLTRLLLTRLRERFQSSAATVFDALWVEACQFAAKHERELRYVDSVAHSVFGRPIVKSHLIVAAREGGLPEFDSLALNPLARLSSLQKSLEAFVIAGKAEQALRDQSALLSWTLRRLAEWRHLTTIFAALSNRPAYLRLETLRTFDLVLDATMDCVAGTRTPKKIRIVLLNRTYLLAKQRQGAWVTLVDGTALGSNTGYRRCSDDPFLLAISTETRQFVFCAKRPHDITQLISALGNAPYLVPMEAQTRLQLVPKQRK